MTLFRSILFLCIQDFFITAEVSRDDSTYELWRVDDVENDDLLNEFEIRAHMNDAIWKKNETYYFIVADYELTYWEKLLNSYNTEWKVLGKNLRGIFDDKFLDNYIEPTKGIEISTRHLKTTKVNFPESEEITDVENPYTTQKIHHLWSTEEVTESHGLVELWRVENVKSQAVLNEFKDRAHLTDEIWKRGDTIDFVVGKHETAYWRRLLRDYGIKFKVLEHNIKEKINDDFIKKYINTRRGGDKSEPKKESTTTTTTTVKEITEKVGPQIEIEDASKQSENSDEYSFDTFSFGKMYSASELWRADNVKSRQVLSEFNDRAHLTDEIWKVNNTIYFILGKHETSNWKTLLQANKIRFHVLERNIKGKFDDKFINKYTKTRRGQK